MYQKSQRNPLFCSFFGNLKKNIGNRQKYQRVVPIIFSSCKWPKFITKIFLSFRPPKTGNRRTFQGGALHKTKNSTFDQNLLS